MSVKNIARTATRSMRIIALPLTPHRQVNGKPVEHLTYYHFVTPPDSKNPNSWAKWAVAKASDLWAGLGKAPEGTWKRRSFLYGERLIDRLEFEELALKSLDPSVGPRLSNIVPHSSKTQEISPIPLVYPPSVCESPIPLLKSLVQQRTPRHKKGFWFWLTVSPLTAPFAIVPIIPNFPFFFCIWRSWHHYRAFKASQYLQGFLRQGAIVPSTSPHLDAIYAKYAPRRGSLPSETHSKKPPPPSDHTHKDELSEKESGSSSPADSDSGLLLTKEAIPELLKTLELPEDSTFAGDMYRALEQARLRLDTDAKT
ncbi:mitochondrial K+-H+ exchange-related-domain-containing protein [Fomes fomentarius]|nr:mitochondrial K+-H+ exchange-related-domain-containing protein [Fomes fomentarius]